MKVDVKFVNFPAHDQIRFTLSSRIEEIVGKYCRTFASARIHISHSGTNHEAKLHVIFERVNVSVSAHDTEPGRAIDHALDKLSATLRKASARRKARKQGLPHHHNSFEAGRGRQRMRLDTNAFYAFEREFENEFDERIELAG